MLILHNPRFASGLELFPKFFMAKLQEDSPKVHELWGNFLEMFGEGPIYHKLSKLKSGHFSDVWDDLQTPSKPRQNQAIAGRTYTQFLQV